MKVLRRLEEMFSAEQTVVLAIGFFDGVHRGHQAVLQEALRHAREQNGEAWVLTFDPHPLKVIRPEIAPRLLTSTPHKLRLLARLGLNGCMVMEFTPELRNLPPEQFIDQLCTHISNLAHMVVGGNWRFGKGGAGNIDLLKRLTPEYGMGMSAVGHIDWQGEPISSTRVREAVTNGQMTDAEEMLGRPFSLWGDVIEGRGIGKALGYPTANIDPHNEVHPPSGIYAAYTIVDEKPYQTAAYIGNRPTFADSEEQWVTEAYLLDTDIELYGHDVELVFVEKIREDQEFASPGELADQIALDIEKTRSILAERPCEIGRRPS